MQGVRIVLSTAQGGRRGSSEAGSPDSVLDAHAALMAEHAGRKRKRTPDQDAALGQLRARLQAECAQVGALRRTQANESFKRFATSCAGRCQPLPCSSQAGAWETWPPLDSGRKCVMGGLDGLSPGVCRSIGLLQGLFDCCRWPPSTARQQRWQTARRMMRPSLSASRRLPARLDAHPWRLPPPWQTAWRPAGVAAQPMAPACSRCMRTMAAGSSCACACAWATRRRRLCC